MNASYQYWKIWRISPSSERLGYHYSLVPLAQDFLHKQLPLLDNQKEVSSNSSVDSSNTQSILLDYFHAQNTLTDAAISAKAGLCLRCYVSEPILKACKKIANLFSGEKFFTYQDLLPFVLNDDGQTLVVLDSDKKAQLILNNEGEVKTSNYKFFSVEVLRTYRFNSNAKMSLINWAYLQTKQNPELKDFLGEFWFKHLSDWALMNRARTKEIERLSERARHLLETFHAVYRRDRLQQCQKGATKCPDPSNAQLQEMFASLREQNVSIQSTIGLLKELRQVATQLRQYDIWSYREPLEIYDPDTGDSTPRPDLPYDSLDELDVEQQEVLIFLNQELKLALTNAIEEEIRSSITKLEKSKKYALFALQFIPGLRLYYCEGKSLKDIAPILGMTSWDQARRILNPGDILSKVRERTVQQVLDKTLEKAQAMGLTKMPPEPDYLKTLLEQIEAFADAEIFQEAVEEIRAGKNRSMDSLYAQQLRVYFGNSKLDLHEELKK
jgi:hypothetical protein